MSLAGSAVCQKQLYVVYSCNGIIGISACDCDALSVISAMSTAFDPRLLTADEYLMPPNDGRLTEVVLELGLEMNGPYTSHSDFRGQFAFVLPHYVNPETCRAQSLFGGSGIDGAERQRQPHVSGYFAWILGRGE
jgi:hypothetical protein